MNKPKEDKEDLNFKKLMQESIVDMALTKAIREGERTQTVSREKVLKLLMLDE